jgi:hypothetical protein
LSGAVHALHEAPQVAGEESLTHAPEHSWKPALHTNPQAPVASHVAVAFAGAGQGLQLAPHAAGEALLTHAPEHSW